MTDATAPAPPPTPRGAIYDLGYVPYDGPRLGRRGAIRATVKDGVRRVMGIRRKGRRKVLPWVLFGVAMLPAIVFVGFAFLTSSFAPEADTPFGSHGGYFDIAANVVILFTALAAPHLLIPDRLDGVLAIYSSRPILPPDYVAARAAALGTVVGGFMLLPQVLMYLGFAALDKDGFFSGLVDNWTELPKIVAAAAFYFLAFAAPALLIAAFAKRTAFATGIYLFVMFASGGIAFALSQAVDIPGGRYGALLAIGDHPRAIRDWIFDISSPDVIPAQAGFGPLWSVATILVIAAITAFILIRRYRRLM